MTRPARSDKAQLGPGPVELRYLDAGKAKRERRLLDLVLSIEAVLHSYRNAADMPLDLVDRCERALVQTHAHNLLKLPEYPRLGGDE